jgi:hypothetical protein
MNLRFLQIAYKNFENILQMWKKYLIVILSLKRGFENEEKGQCVMFVILTFLDTFNWWLWVFEF